MKEVRISRITLRIIIVLLFVLSLCTFYAGAYAQSTDLPIHLHLTWQNDTSTTITVTWQTNTPTSGDTVLYDQVSRQGEVGEYKYSVTGKHYTYEGASGYIHNVELTGLTPDTVYYFICGGSSGGYGEERSFRTATSISSDVRFVMGGDSQIYYSRPEYYREVREKISLAMAKTNPSFVLHSGDIVMDGKVQSEWDEWFNHVDSNWIGENGQIIPIITALGNHENPQSTTSKYFPQFVLPGNERWYSLDWGPDIHIIVLDNAYILNDVSGPQLDWLKEDLESHSNYLWKFVVYHKPAFEGSARDYWVPFFDEYHVDIVFNGHIHGYQRTYPINWLTSQTEVQDYSNGTMYIISGGWGGGLSSHQPYWFMAYQNLTHNFCVVDVFANNTLRLQAKDINGNLIDKVSFSKSPEIKQEPFEETITETEEPESEPNKGIPGFPYISILAALVIYYLLRARLQSPAV
ncbi:MAG: metallophosphoesterase family protein [Candidatus Bathyarchaeota archaeon]|nr:MAG: metallophosphoesterase family protein [Candidatus Bathyarchaeota archaeon]